MADAQIFVVRSASFSADDRDSPPWMLTRPLKDYAKERWFLSSDFEARSNIAAMVKDDSLMVPRTIVSLQTALPGTLPGEIIKWTGDVRAFYRWHSDSDGEIREEGYQAYRTFRDSPPGPRIREFPTTARLHFLRTKLLWIMDKLFPDTTPRQYLMAELVFANAVMAHLEHRYEAERGLFGRHMLCHSAWDMGGHASLD